MIKPASAVMEELEQLHAKLDRCQCSNCRKVFVVKVRQLLPQLLAIAKEAIAFLPKCPTCGGTGTSLRKPYEIAAHFVQCPCPTCGPLREAIGGVK